MEPGFEVRWVNARRVRNASGRENDVAGAQPSRVVLGSLASLSSLEVDLMMQVSSLSCVDGALKILAACSALAMAALRRAIVSRGMRKLALKSTFRTLS